MPNGLATGGSVSSVSGREPVADHPEQHPADPAHATQRQRGDGGRPSGNSSGSATPAAPAATGSRRTRRASRRAGQTSSGSLSGRARQVAVGRGRRARTRPRRADDPADARCRARARSRTRASPRSRRATSSRDQLLRRAAPERDRRRPSARAARRSPRTARPSRSAILIHGGAEASSLTGSLELRREASGKTLRCALPCSGDLAAGSAAGPPRRRAGLLRHAQGHGAARPPRAGRAAALARGAVRAAVARPGPRARARGAAADAVGGAQGGRRGVGRHRGRQRRAARAAPTSTCAVPGAAAATPVSSRRPSRSSAAICSRASTLRDSPPFDAWQVREADALQRELGAVLGRLVRALAEAR